jgi:DNA-directed RNA polymerase specialized sigma24 family protein
LLHTVDFRVFYIEGGEQLGDESLKAYDLYYDMIYRYVCVKVGNKWDAEDIVSEVFKKAFEYFGTIKSHRKAIREKLNKVIL